MPKLIIQWVKCIAEAEGQPVTISFETSRGNIIDFGSSLNESDMTGVYDGDTNEYDSDFNDNNKNEIEILHYHHPSEEHNNHRSLREDDKSEIENNEDDLQES